MTTRQVRSAGKKKAARRTAPRKKAAKAVSKRTLALRSGRGRDEVKSFPASAVKKSASAKPARTSGGNRKRGAETADGYGFAVGDAFPSLVASQMRFMETMLRWSPLGFLMRMSERSDERTGKPKPR